MIQFVIFIVVVALQSSASAADSLPNRATADNAMSLLQKVAQTSMTLSYSGVFVYRSGEREETSRIARLVSDGRELERIEVLDGSAREVIRDGKEVKCFLPNENRVIIERPASMRGFPAFPALGLAGLEQNYALRVGGLGRVADTPCQSLVLEPRDALRYGHQLWIEPTSGLLLKAGLVNKQGQVLESFTFTQVSIGSTFARQQLTPSAESLQGRVQKVHSSEPRAGEIKWAIENLPAGFRVSKIMLRRAANSANATNSPNPSDVVHFVISDGLAAVSVFIEAAAANKPSEAISTGGAMNFYQRQIGDHRAIVMGEVPMVTVKMIADAIERRER